MRFQLRVGSKEFLVTADQLADVMAILENCEYMGEHHVGKGKGSQGYDNSYVPVVRKPRLRDVLMCLPVDDDLIDTIKLTMKLNDIREYD